MGGSEEKAYHRCRVALQYFTDGEEITQRLGHFFFVNGDKAIVHPVAGKHRVAAHGSFALCNLILMMRKNQVLPPAMNVKLFTQVFHRHR